MNVKMKLHMMFTAVTEESARIQRDPIRVPVMWVILVMARIVSPPHSARKTHLLDKYGLVISEYSAVYTFIGQ